ncbi:MAG: type II toxin-antitoxin system RelE/ParE family toxin [Pyrinomonadaceae bacterium]
MKISILAPARFDLIDGYWFYEEQQTGLGDQFVESIFADIDSLLITAGIHFVLFGKHRMIASKFPYSIFYLVGSNEVRIHAVLDNRRDPSWISDRLG